MSNDLLLIDGDILCFKAGCPHYDTHFDVETMNLPAAIESLEFFIGDIHSRINPEAQVRIFLTMGKSFRHDLFPAYKKHRKPAPPIIAPLRQYLLEHKGAEFEEGLEADDLMGLNQTGTSVICTIDKDLLQIPGKHYHWDADRLITISPEEGLRNFFAQVLSGDSTDNFKGCPGIGTKLSREIVSEGEVKDLWDAVVFTYLTSGLSVNQAILNARLAYILHPGDTHDYLWEPPESTDFTTLANLLKEQK